jgi:AGZA family xanthine/uracil permease-like MFS transporter
MREFLRRTFHMDQLSTTPRTEILGGATTFATMAYIIVVNPAILQNAGIPVGPSTVATILAAVFGCLLMGLYANRPFAVAPYMGENAFIAFGLAASITWQQRLGTVFVSGVLFFILTLFRARTWLAGAISVNLKHSFAIGIGLFLLFLGLFQTGIVARNEAGVPLRIGDFGQLRVQLAIAGFFTMVLLQHWRVPGGILLTIAAIATVGVLLGVGEAPRAVFTSFDDLSLREVAFQLDIASVLRVDFAGVLLTLFLISFLDTLGTMFALGSAGGLLDEKGDLPELEKPMIVDSLACIFSALIGTSTSGAFIESATGIREGARTGLAAVVTGLLFAASLLFLPLVQPLQQLAFAYGPALMLVGLAMFGAARHLDYDDLTELVPALATIAMMVFTFNIANGLTAGLVLHPLLKLLTGKGRTIHPGSALLGGLCLLYYGLGYRH